MYLWFGWKTFISREKKKGKKGEKKKRKQKWLSHSVNIFYFLSFFLFLLFRERKHRIIALLATCIFCPINSLEFLSFQRYKMDALLLRFLTQVFFFQDFVNEEFLLSFDLVTTNRHIETIKFVKIQFNLNSRQTRNNSIVSSKLHISKIPIYHFSSSSKRH